MYLPVVIIAIIGDVLGSLVLYGIGFFLEEKVILNLIKKHGKYILVSEHDYQKASGWFIKYGSKIVVVAKFFPGLRFIISLPAGVFEMNVWKFISLALVGSIAWVSVLTYVGMYLGSKWDSLGGYFSKFQFVIVVLLILAVLWYLDHKLSLRKKIFRK